MEKNNTHQLHFISADSLEAMWKKSNEFLQEDQAFDESMDIKNIQFSSAISLEGKVIFSCMIHYTSDISLSVD